MPNAKTANKPVEQAATTEPTKRQIFRAQIVTVVAEKNPKKKGSMSYDRFEDYFKLKGGESVDQVLRTTNIRMDDIRHDSEHGFIKLEAPSK